MVKQHIYTGNLVRDIECLLATNTGGDGSIFTNIQREYRSVVYKAKPKDLMTLDFLIGPAGQLQCYEENNGHLVYNQLGSFTLPLSKKPLIKPAVRCNQQLEYKI